MSQSPQKNRRNIINKAVVFALASGAFSVHAEKAQMLQKTTVADKQQETYKIEKVSTHKITTDILNTPKTINVINTEVMADQGITNLSDALRNVAGVSTFGAGEGGGGNITTNDKITIRGFNANGNIYIDGVRDLAGYSRDMFNTEQVEVAKGASSSLTGKGTSGGAVNLVTKMAQQDDFTNLDLSYDDAERLRVTMDFNASLSNKAAVRLNAVHSDGGDALDNGVEEYKTQAIAPSIRLDLSDDFTLIADALFMKQDNNPMLGLPYVTESFAKKFGLKQGPIDSKYWHNYYGVSKRDFEKVDVAMATFLMDYQISDTVSLRNKTRFGQNDKQSVAARPIYLKFNNPEYDPELNLDVPRYIYKNEIDLAYTRNLDEEHTLFVNQLDLISKFTRGKVEHNLIVGTEFYMEDKTSQNLSNNVIYTSDNAAGVNIYNEKGELLIEGEDAGVSLDAPFPDLSYTGGIEVDGTPSKANGEGIAFYMLDNISIGDEWLLTAGLRYEDYKVTGQRYMWQRGDNGWEKYFVPGLKSEGDFFSWNLSAGYKPSADSFVYLAAANSQDPAAGDLAFSWSEKAVKQIGELDPMEAKNYEVGGKIELFENNLQLTAAYFHTTKTVTDRDDDRNYFLAGEQQAKGLELSATGRINQQFDVIATYTHQDTEVTKDFSEDTEGNGLTAAPDDMASVWLTYQLDQLQFGLGAQYSSGETYWRRSRAYFETGSYTLVNAMVGYDVTDNFKLQLNVDNLADEEYITDYSARGHFKPGNPRLIKLSARYQF